MRWWQLAEDAAVISLLPKGTHRGSSWFGRTGDIVQQPPVWAAVAAALALGGGERGRRAAVRGSVCDGLTAIVGEPGPEAAGGKVPAPGAGEGQSGPVTSSFPSGHAATDLAFALAAAQEIPLLFLVLGPATTAAHWSLVRSRGHYPSDVLAGGILAIAVVLVAWRIWPPRPTAGQDDDQEKPDEPSLSITGDN